jgi:hypothetical protein
MKKKIDFAVLLFASVVFFSLSCQKEISKQPQKENEGFSTPKSENAETPPFNLEVILRGQGNRFGHVKFRQDNDPAKIITLITWIRDLEPNHQYLLQRATDVIIDDNCTGTNWLTLGKGPTPQSILTDATGTGREELWRDLSAVPSGSVFDIHFRVLDATSMAVVLTSDCYQFIVR